MRLLRARRGTTAIEFAIAAIPLLVLLIGIIELSWQYATAAALDAAVLRASRFGITGQATAAGAPPQYTCRSQTIPWIIGNSTGGIINPANLKVSIQSYGNASDLAAGTPVPGAGTAGQIVTYSVKYTQPFLTGAWITLIGGPASLTHHAQIVVKNEPFDNATC